jgi:nucleotidyltransferase substrate binding protein (TIGR01987 family)
MQMQAHVEQLERAAARLAEGLARHRSEPADEQLRDGLIQRFEFTYDLATKVLRRALKTISATPEAVDLMSYPDLTRTGWEMDFLKGGWPAWKALRDTRNTTSHLYDESKAIDAVAKIPAFQAEIEHFLDRLRARAWE